MLNLRDEVTYGREPVKLILSLFIVLLLISSASAIENSEQIHSLGSSDAPVTINMYTDFACPYCQHFSEQVLPLIKSEYIDTGWVRLVYMAFPIVSDNSQKAAEAAECAGDQDNFWEMHDKLFGQLDEWSDGGKAVTFFKKYAGELQIEWTAFSRCIDTGKYREKVQDQKDTGTYWEVTGVPTFFINGNVITGAQPFSVFQDVIDEALREESGVDKEPGEPKYDYIEYHAMAEGRQNFGDYDPINPKSIFYTDEEKAVLVYAYNRLDGEVGLSFYFYKDGAFVKSWPGSDSGDGGRHTSTFVVTFDHFQMFDITGDWQIDTYIDETHAFTDEFSIFESTLETPEGETFGVMFIVNLIFYMIFFVPYFIVQKVRKKGVRPKTTIIGGTAVFVFLVFILIPGADGGITESETTYLTISALLIIGLIHLLGRKFQSKEKKEAPPQKPAPVERDETIAPKPKAPAPKPEEKIEKEPPKKSGPMKSCPYCKGKLSELNFYKLKSGNDITCEYCGEIISH